MLKQIEDPLGKVTLLENYNAWEKPGDMRDPNDISTHFEYDLMGRMTSRTTAGVTTSVAYDGAGKITAIHLPDNRCKREPCHL